MIWYKRYALNVYESEHVLLVLMTNEFLVSGRGVNGTYTVGRASCQGVCGFRPPGFPLVYKTVTLPGGGQYVKIGPLS